MNRRGLAALMAAVCLLTMTGCTSRQPSIREEEPVYTLAPATVGYAAPDGDIPPGEERMYPLYLPGKNGLHLLAEHITLPPARTLETLRMLSEALLRFEGNDQVNAVGGETRLSLYGLDPIELSGGICTVNLASSALELDYREFYLMSLALATTLCEVDGVTRVNVLVADQSVGLDVTGGLAMGSLTAHPGENLPVLWEQMEARRTPLGNDMSQTPLRSEVTLYYPLARGQGVICEDQSITFEGQTPQQMASRILETISGGSQYISGVAEIPSLASLLLHEPVASELDDGGRMITLSLREDTMIRLREKNIDPVCMMAAIVLSLTTFIPGTSAVCVRLGESPITQLNSEKYGSITTLGGLMRRGMFTQFIMERTTVYFERDGKLVPCEKNVDMFEADSPRTQLKALLEGPGEREAAEGMSRTLPDTVTEEDILGIASEGDTLLVNLSEHFLEEIRRFGPEKERLLCYSVVDTLCQHTGINRMCFFFEGAQVEEIAGEIYWAGIFDWNAGLIEPSFG